MKETSGFTYVEIRSDGADTLPLGQLEPIADQIVSLVSMLTDREEVAVWPTGTEEGFAWPDGFGQRSQTQATELLRAQLLRRAHVGDGAVFPRMTFGGWELEVFHPSPPGSSTAFGVFLSGPRSRTDTESMLGVAMGTPPAPGVHDDVQIAAGPLTATVAETGPNLAGQLVLDGASRARKTWTARIGEDVRNVGARIWCDPPLMNASGATSIAELYGQLAAVTHTPARWPRRLWPVRAAETHLHGATVRVDLTVPGGSSPSRQDLLDLAGTPEARYGGCITIQASTRRQRGRRLGWGDSGKVSVLDEWHADIAGTPSQLRYLERTAEARTRWQWLQITQAPTAAVQPS